jgi:transcription elongation factor GreB
MSRAFVKEDVDPPERIGRPRSASGLPPGAINYITAAGAARLRSKFEDLRRSDREEDAQRVAELRSTLASITTVEIPEDEKTIAFGSKVTVQDDADQLRSYRIVGVDELNFYSDAVPWVSQTAKTLLAAEVGDRVTLENDGRVQIIAVEYPRE